MRTEERLADVMGTTAHVIVTGGTPGLAERAVDALHALEARWSRFRPDSEISRLNARPGVPVLVSPETFVLVARAVEGWRLTGGRFDPTLLPELRAAGYDRSFELVRAGAGQAGATDAAPKPTEPESLDARLGAGAIFVDPVVGAVMLPPGTELDPGGIGKGLAADLVVERLLADGAAGALVSVGGDLRAEGAAPGGSGWVVAVADPVDEDRVLDTVGFDAGAVASSWRTKRAWTGPDGSARHHLIDPTTGAPAITGVRGVTVVSGLGWHAEVLAKAAFLAGMPEGARLIADRGAAGLVVTDDGSVTRAGDFARIAAVRHPGLPPTRADLRSAHGTG